MERGDWNPQFAVMLSIAKLFWPVLVMIRCDVIMHKVC